MGKNSLSKTTYIKGLQCLKYLYLYKKHYNLQDKLSAEKLAKFKRGHNVGDLAQKLFPGGVNLKPASHFQYSKAIEATQYHIKNQTAVIYEAAFNYGSILIFLDILVNDNGRYFAYEVKSSLSISETYIEDAALQYYVLCGAGIQPDDMSLITVNENYILKNSLDVHSYFKKQSVLDLVRDRQSKVVENIALQKEVLLQSTIPDIPVGDHCFTPYQCDFKGYCWKHIPNDKPTHIHIDNDGLEKHLSQIHPDFCLLEIFSMQPAVPLFENNRPYELFTYMVSFKWNNGHAFYLCNNSFDDRKGLLDFITEMQKQFSSFVVFDKTTTYNLLIKTAAIINYNQNSIDALFEKVTGVNEIIKDGTYISHKIKTPDDKEGLMHDLGLKNPFPKKGKPNNIYDAAALYEEYVCTLKNEIRDVLENYAIESNNYLNRLLDFFRKKLK